MIFLKKICLLGLIFFIYTPLCIILSSCSANYAFSNIDKTSLYENSNIPPPEAEIKQLNKETIYTTTNVEVDGEVIYISSPTLVNYSISDLNNYIFVFYTDAIITINDTFHSKYSTSFISLSTNLHIVLNANIYCGETSYDLDDELLTNCAIYANNLTIYGQGQISSSNQNINAITIIISTTNSIKINSNQAAIYCNTFYMFAGHLDICAQTAIIANDIILKGGIVNISNCSIAIDCTNFKVEKALLNINSATAINCKYFLQSNGYITLNSKIGINAQNVEINNGYLYVQGKQIAIKATYALNINGGTSILVATNNYSSAIDAETANFNIYGGLLISNSYYACKPQTSALFFDIQSPSIITLENKQDNLVYIPQVSGMVMIASNTTYSYYSLNGKINQYTSNFYGLLFEADINTLSNKSINYDFINDYSKIYNGRYHANGQLF